jgi:4-amino-4-deoxy-L-arabinose transferase-like glycosyltransferase
VTSADQKWVIFGVALGMAVLWTALANFSSFREGVALVTPDSTQYMALARSLLGGEGYLADGVPTSRWLPGYPIFLAGLFWLFGESTLWVGLVQSLLHATNALVLFFLGRRLFGNGVGVTAGFMAALYPFYLFFVPILLTETITVLLASLSLLFIYRAGEGRPWDFFWAGLFSGGAALIRPGYLTLALLMIPYLFWMGRRKLRRTTVGVSLATGVVVLMLLPWALHNLKLQGNFLVGVPRTGEALWTGTNPLSRGGNDGYHDSWQIAPLPYPVHSGISETKKDALYYKAFFEYVSEHPGRFFAVLPEKLVNFWRPTWGGSSLRNWIVLGVPYILLMFLAFLGLSRARQNWGGTILLFIFLGFWFLVPLVFYALLRVRVQAMTPLILFAALGLQTLWQWRPSGPRVETPKG